MNADQLKALQTPLKDRYRADPASALHTMRVEGELRQEKVTCIVKSVRGPIEAGLHPAAGGTGEFACSGDMLLEALLGCAGVTLAAVAYNAVLIFGLAQPVWLILARALPPIASSMSVMMIPVLGTVIGALWLGEALHWQDGAAIVLVLLAIASVMWPTRVPAPARPAEVGNL